MVKVKINYYGLIQNMVNNPEAEGDLLGVTAVRELLCLAGAAIW